MDGQLQKAIQSVYKENSCCVKLNRNLTGWFGVYRGLKQSCTLSPMLFNLYVNDLAHEIQALHKGVTFDDDSISVLLYADDLVILAESPEDLQCQLNTLSQWRERWKLKVNYEKSNTVHFRPPSALRTSFLFKVDDMPLQVVSSYKYLGKLLYEYLDYYV